MWPTARALLIDLDGVMRHWDPGNDARAEAEAGLPSGALRAAAFAPDLLMPAITGRVSDQQWRQSVAEHLGARYPEADAALAVRLWSEPCGRVDATVVALVARCRAHVPAVLVTNATTRLPLDLARLGLDNAFDSIINSAQVGIAKPAPGIFAEALRRVQVSASEALFVDDAPANVAAAAGAGLQAHVYRGAEDLSALFTRYGWM